MTEPTKRGHQVTRSFESELEAIERWNPLVEAFVDWCPATAARRAAAAISGPLSGWSVVVKDIIDLAAEPTRCNADFIPAQPAPKHAAIVDCLVRLGAFILAKSVTTTFAYLDPGPTRNPWNLEHTPGGSSSGSAAAVACGLARLALGSQTVGSVNRPASYCGVVGFKPTYGRIPTEGVFPFSPSVDTMGFFTRHVGDMQAVFEAVVQESAVRNPSVPLKVAVVTNLGCEAADPEMIDAVQAVAGKLRHAGHRVCSLELPAFVKKAYELHFLLIRSEVADVHREYFRQYGSGYRPRLREAIERGQQVTSQQLQGIQKHRKKTITAFDQLLDDNDIWLLPSAAGIAPRGLDSTGDPRMNLLATYTGVPALTLPVALGEHGLPLGVQVIGRRMNDRALLAAGAVIEQLIGFEHQPRLPGASG
ncbi:MAG: amidase [Phycisphaeraceae bacterium]|nr:amidase [Phycisphaeraceae bacterium]